MKKQHLLWLGFLSAIVPVSTYATNGYFVHGNGIQSQGTAGVGIALFQDALTGANNPAGISWVGNRADIGATLFNPDRRADITGNGYGANGHYNGNGKRYFVLPELALVQRLDNVPVSVGLALYGNGGLNTGYKNNPYAAFGNRGPAGVNLAQLFFTPSVSWQYADNQSIGIAANVLYQRFSATGIQGFAPFSQDGTALSDNKSDSSTGVGGRIGWSGKFANKLTLGATYASKIDASKLHKYRGLFADAGQFDVPANYGVGLAYQPVQPLTLAADVQRIQYSDVASVHHRFDANQLLAGNLFGTANGPGFGWKDVTVYKLGATYALNPQLTLRGGYSHATQPIPNDQTFLNVLAPGVIQDHASVGATWAIDPHQEVSVAYTHGFNKKVKGSGSIPVAFGGGEANIQLQENIVGLAYGLKY